MNLILLEKKDFIDKNRVRLDDARFEQIKTVHGSVSGDTVRVGELGEHAVGFVKQYQHGRL